MNVNRVYIQRQSGIATTQHVHFDIKPEAFAAVYQYLEPIQQNVDIGDSIHDYCWAWAETSDCEQQINQVSLTKTQYIKLVQILFD